jgi:hypothetical protein
MADLVQNKIHEFRRNADACEDWAATVNHPDIKQGFLEIARQWRDMADRFEQLQISLPSDDRS